MNRTNTMAKSMRQSKRLGTKQGVMDNYTIYNYNGDEV